MDVVWVGAAYIAGLLGSRVGFPPLVGYLLAGFVLFVFGHAKRYFRIMLK